MPDTIEGAFGEAVARYHLHPEVAATGEGSAGALRLPGGQALRWAATVGTVRAVASTWHPAFGRSLLLTLWIAGVSTAVSTLIALLAALVLRRSFPGKHLATFLFQANLPIPHLVGAIGILFLFSQSGLLARLGHLAGIIRCPPIFRRWCLIRTPWVSFWSTSGKAAFLPGSFCWQRCNPSARSMKMWPRRSGPTAGSGSAT